MKTWRFIRVLLLVGLVVTPMVNGFLASSATCWLCPQATPFGPLAADADDDDTNGAPEGLVLSLTDIATTPSQVRISPRPAQSQRAVPPAQLTGLPTAAPDIEALARGWQFHQLAARSPRAPDTRC